MLSNKSRIKSFCKWILGVKDMFKIDYFYLFGIKIKLKGK